MEELAAAEGIDLAESAAYSDSATDEPMLAAVGHPGGGEPRPRAAPHRPQPRAGRSATSSGPVRLRDRMPRPPTAPAVAVGGGVVAVTAAAVTWWALRRSVAAPLPPPSTQARRVAQLTRAAEATGRGVGYARTFLAAMVPRAMITMRSNSFFMGRGR